VVGNLNSNYAVSQLYQALSNFKLTMAPGSQFQYPSSGMGLLAHILSLKSSGVPYEHGMAFDLKDRILNVLGMIDTKITLTE
jgi:CubicO group peptidase (beta-lactamase class C family)